MFYLRRLGRRVAGDVSAIQRHVRDEYIAVFSRPPELVEHGHEASADDVATGDAPRRAAQLDTVNYRVYIQGLSSRAGMAHTAAIRSDQITGIAAYAALCDDVRPREGLLRCRCSRCSTEDDICPYDDCRRPARLHERRGLRIDGQRVRGRA